MIEINGKKALSLSEACAKLVCSDRWLRDKLTELGIQTHQIGKLKYVLENDLEQLLGGGKPNV